MLNEIIKMIELSKNTKGQDWKHNIKQIKIKINEYAKEYHESEVKKLNIHAVSNSIKIALLKQLEELSDYIPAEIYTKKVIEIQSNFNDC